MDAKLSEQIQEAIDDLTQAQKKAFEVKQAMRKQRISFGLNYDHADDDIGQLIGRLRYMKLMALRRELAEAQAQEEAQTEPDGV